MPCAELRAQAHGGIGNQLLFVLSVAALAQWAEVDTCTIRLAEFRYGEAVTDLTKYFNVRDAAR